MGERVGTSLWGVRGCGQQVAHGRPLLPRDVQGIPDGSETGTLQGAGCEVAI